MKLPTFEPIPGVSLTCVETIAAKTAPESFRGAGLLTTLVKTVLWLTTFTFINKTNKKEKTTPRRFGVRLG